MAVLLRGLRICNNSVIYRAYHIRNVVCVKSITSIFFFFALEFMIAYRKSSGGSRGGGGGRNRQTPKISLTMLFKPHCASECLNI